jgi:hypothetical protein
VVAKVKKRVRAAGAVVVVIVSEEAEIAKTEADVVIAEIVEIEASAVNAESEATVMSGPQSRGSVSSASRSLSTRRLASTSVQERLMAYQVMPSLRM